MGIKNGSGKLKLRIAQIITESEVRNKHCEKKKLKNETIAISNQLKREIYFPLMH